MLLVAVALGCGNSRTVDDGSNTGNSSPAKSGPSGTVHPTASGERFTKVNFVRVQPGMSLVEVEKIFGSAATNKDVGGGETEYTWGPKDKQLWVKVNKGKVAWVRWPGKEEHEKRLRAAIHCLPGLARSLEEYAIRNGCKFPPSAAELKLIGGSAAETPDLLKSGEIVVPWGETANQMVWAWWKDTPEFGGPYIRYDLKLTENATPADFTKLKGVKLTAKTIPAEHTTPTPWEKTGEPGFYVSSTIMLTLSHCTNDPKIPAPTGLHDYPVFMVRGDLPYAALRMIESGEIVVRWDRHPAKGLYMYPKDFPKKGGWAVYNGSFTGVISLAEAEKLLAKP
jgi:hypothetical protein